MKYRSVIDGIPVLLKLIILLPKFDNDRGGVKILKLGWSVAFCKYVSNVCACVYIYIYFFFVWLYPVRNTTSNEGQGLFLFIQTYKNTLKPVTPLLFLFANYFIQY